MLGDTTRVFYGANRGMKNEPTAIEWNGISCSSISTHAEMNLIKNYLSNTNQNKQIRKKHGKYQFKGKMIKTIVVVSYYKNKWRCSRPCDDCLNLLKYYGVKKVIYSTGLDDPNKSLCMEKVKHMKYNGKSSGNSRYIK